MSDKITHVINAELPKVICAITLVHVPTIVYSAICPHCGELNIEELEGENKELLTSCLKCDRDYKIIIPNFEIVKNQVICP